MNWVDALSTAHLDAATAIGKAAHVAGPEELHRLVGTYLVHRASGLPRAPGRLSTLVERLRFPPPAKEPTLAGLCGWWTDQVGLAPSERLLDPEGMLALVQWCVGSETEPGGFFRLFWAAVEPDPKVYAADLDRLDRVAEMVVLTLREEARAEAERVGRTPHMIRSLWQNLGQDGAACHRDHDGYSSAALRASRRRIVAGLLDRPNGMARWAEGMET
jgi:hypothetical protein